MATLQELLQQFAGGQPRQQARQALTSGNLSFFEGGEQRQLARNLFQSQQPPAPRFDVSVTGFQPDLQGIAQERGLDTSRALDILNRAVNRPGIRQEFGGLLGRGPNVSAGRPLLEAIMGSVNPTAQSFLQQFLNQPESPPPGPEPPLGPGGPGGPGGQVPGPATDTLNEGPDFTGAVPVEGGGGPTFPQFGDLPPDELSENIQARLNAIITGEGLEGFQPPPADLSELETIFQSGGLNPDLLFEQRKSLEENLAGSLESGLEDISDVLSERRLTRGGAQRGEILDLNERLQGDLFRNLRDFAVSQGLGAQDRSLSAAQSLAGSRLEGRQQDIAGFQNLLNQQLDAINQATGRALGIGDLALRNQIANQDFAQFLADDQFRTAQFIESVRQAREGRVSGFLQLMLQFLGSAQQGFI